MLEGWVPYAIISASAVVLIAVTIVLARVAWRRQVRRYLVGLMGRREAVGAALRTVDAAVSTLVAGDVVALLAFTEPESEDRHVFSEVAERLRIQASELADMALPKALWPLADDLQRAASGLAAQCAGVGEGAGEQVLDALVLMDLGEIRTALRSADLSIAAAAESYSLSDPAVYGGGLYI